MRAFFDVKVGVEDGVIVAVSWPQRLDDYPAVCEALASLEPDTDNYCFCGLALDPGQMFCGVDPACRLMAEMEHPRD